MPSVKPALMTMPPIADRAESLFDRSESDADAFGALMAPDDAHSAPAPRADDADRDDASASNDREPSSDASAIRQHTPPPTIAMLIGLAQNEDAAIGALDAGAQSAGAAAPIGTPLSGDAPVTREQGIAPMPGAISLSTPMQRAQMFPQTPVTFSALATTTNAPSRDLTGVIAPVATPAHSQEAVKANSPAPQQTAYASALLAFAAATRATVGQSVDAGDAGEAQALANATTASTALQPASTDPTLSQAPLQAQAAPQSLSQTMQWRAPTAQTSDQAGAAATGAVQAREAATHKTASRAIGGRTTPATGQDTGVGANAGASNSATPQTPSPMQAVQIITPTASDAGGGETPIANSTTPVSHAGAASQDAHRSASATPASAPTAPRAQPAAAQLAQQIIRRFDGGATQFELRLDPVELGRVDVRIEVGRDKRVTALVAAENPSTLTDLVRAARDLERILESAGLTLDDQGVQFSLTTDQGRDGQGAPAQRDGARDAAAGPDASDPSASPQAASPFGMERWRSHRIDLFA